MSTDATVGRPHDFSFDPNDPHFDVDPNPTWDHLRENAPVYWWPAAHGWVVTRYADVVTVLTDRRFSTELIHYPKLPLDLPDDLLESHRLLARHGLFWVPQDDHRRIRSVLAPLFTAGAVETYRPVAEQVADDVLDPLRDRNRLDIAAQVTAGLPLEMTMHLLGMPLRLHTEFRLFGAAIVDLFYPGISQVAVEVKAAHLPRGLALLDELLDERQTAQSDDLVSSMLHARHNGDSLTRDEVRSMVALLMSTASEPVGHLINVAMLNLLRHPDAMEQVRDDTSLIPAAIDEAYRYDGFGKLNLPRFPLEDVELSGVRIGKGEQIFGAFASASRDERAFPDAAVFDLHRDKRKSLLFGDGPHVCLGRWLSMVVVGTMVEKLVTGFPEMRLAGDPVYTQNTFFRKMVSLPVVLGR
ncbi:cytochrome P450 [Amycolatopsis sp. NPDC059090]|uniref:cytochrome P450 n=1 Tax=unclassified Amycolatopsis TaxID=2618356 RepID=UPI003670270C